MKTNIYDAEYVDYLVENDEIDAQEAGFMYWYDNIEEGDDTVDLFS